MEQEPKPVGASGCDSRAHATTRVAASLAPSSRASARAASRPPPAWQGRPRDCAHTREDRHGSPGSQERPSGRGAAGSAVRSEGWQEPPDRACRPSYDGRTAGPGEKPCRPAGCHIATTASIASSVAPFAAWVAGPWAAAGAPGRLRHFRVRGTWPRLANPEVSLYTDRQ